MDPDPYFGGRLWDSGKQSVLTGSGGTATWIFFGFSPR